MGRLKYCSFCGEKLILKNLLDGSREKYCKTCTHVFFDAPSPAIIVAVTREDNILLTRSIEWKHPYWGLIAGHVKSGETAEEAVIREVHEEVGIDIFDVEILGTSVKNHELLMIEFTAKTRSNTLKKGKELEKVAWFNLNDPLSLYPNSIANKVVNKIISRAHSSKP
jgi:NAD+ diphosphatase